ncbi:MAG: K+-dependent Na+/Ca+ exchanger-like protein [Candidatus Syntrophoarchaeum caldarius]|uniref:K+-dependent Na+/Ca+ exchanger-like protein n=1 Tax=Candidatus Syntropharchaeum caldarium TaxID=1838285 RepID=A0A1F2P7V8_9EURY|nr:MAG: K+-dependent Na+/Ca+ exchanger-like protein [Candidatus Syntrophoarchaeum caldarius]
MIDHAALVAMKRNVSHHSIGMTLVALVTSLPEFAISTFSSFVGEADIAIANVVGSNITNIALALGLLLLLKPYERKEGCIDAGFMLAITLICGALMLDLQISRIDGLILFLIIFAFIYLMKQKKNYQMGEAYQKTGVTEKEASIWTDILISILGMGGVWIGGWMIINGVVGISTLLGIPSLALSLTVVALGTSLPELATSIIAIRKNVGDIAVGTLIGSNILNIVFVLGTAAMVRPIAVAESIVIYYLPLMIITALLTVIFIKLGRMGRVHGIILLLIYAAFLVGIGMGI